MFSSKKNLFTYLTKINKFFNISNINYINIS